MDHVYASIPFLSVCVCHEDDGKEMRADFYDFWIVDSRLHSVGDPATKKCPVPHKLGFHFFGNAESRISQGLQRRWGESRNVKEKLWDLSRENVYFASNY